MNNTRSWPAMPPAGVADLVLDGLADSVERFRFWLLTHTEFNGQQFWRTAVLRVCLPDPALPLRFEVADGRDQYPRVPTAPPTEATTRIQLPWAEAQLAEGSVDASNDGTPEPIDDDPISGVRAIQLPLCDGVVTPEPEPVYHARTRALAVLSIGERLALMKAVEIAARRSQIDVGVSAMPYQNPTAVHLQAANWREFCAWLKGQARSEFRDVALELTLPVGKREAARYTLRCLADAAPEMLRLRVGDVLYLPFRD